MLCEHRTLRTVSSHKRGVLRLRENEAVIKALDKNFNKASNTPGMVIDGRNRVLVRTTIILWHQIGWNRLHFYQTLNYHRA